jgi:Domain of unknown function (DUF4391)
MTSAELIAALELPQSVRVDQRVPKKLLLENGAPTATDKRTINDGIESMQWLAALKPATTGVAAYRDEAREYLEIAVLHVAWRDAAKTSRLTELIHRAIPYPVVLLAESGAGVTTAISLAHKRWAQNEAGKMVLDGEVMQAQLADANPDIACAFLRALALAAQPRTSMLSLYRGWENSVTALQAALLTGKFALFDSDERTAARRAALGAVARLQTRISELHRAAVGASQLARQVELNIELARVRNELAAVQAQL